MLRIGCHLSSSKGYCAMAKDALKISASWLAARCAWAGLRKHPIP